MRKIDWLELESGLRGDCLCQAEPSVGEPLRRLCREVVDEGDLRGVAEVPLLQPLERDERVGVAVAGVTTLRTPRCPK